VQASEIFAMTNMKIKNAFLNIAGALVFAR